MRSDAASTRTHTRWIVALTGALLCALTAPLLAPAAAGADPVLPSGFRETTVISGLTHPSVVRFASDGRVFVAEKSGLIKVFDSLSDTTPTIVADLRTEVDDYWDRGLLGFALDPNFPANPYVYALYTRDAPIGGTTPTWNDACPSPPGPTTDGCVVSGRLVRIQVSGNTMTGSPKVLVDGWCQQYPSHSVGALNFGPDGALYASAGDGASFVFADYGQGGGSSGSPTPANPCGDPPAGIGGAQTPATAEGGALRSQSLRRPAGEPVVLNGSIIRVDPATGDALPSNPGAAATDPNARRIVAYGMRNPFRFTFRPGTSELWAGDVGWGTWEEINRRLSPTAPVDNFGWPCFEGPDHPYPGLSINLCNSLYAAGTAVPPYFTYNHNSAVVNGESCPTANGSSISGLAFYNGGSYPSQYNGALFFSDYTRKCIWAMPPGANGLPDPSKIETIDAGAAGPVNLETGPGGDLFYVDFDGGTIRRISYGNGAPPSSTYLSDIAPASATNGWGPVEKDTSNGEQAAGDGHPLTLNGSVYPKGLGVHALSDISYNLGGGCNRFKASVGVDDEAGSQGSVSFQVYADTTKVFDSGTMTGDSPTQSIDVSVAGANTLRLVTGNGGDNLDNDHADWALARIECGSDSSPPTVTAQMPADGATGVSLNSTPAATFSEPINPATLSTTTFTLLRQGTTTPVAAAVSYDSSSQRATLTPNAALATGASYTATVRGGTGGVTDLNGNPLSGDVSWAFTTGNGTTPPSSTYLSDIAPASATNGWGPVEKDTSNGEQAAGDGHPLTLNGSVYPKGLGVHALSDISYNLGGGCNRFKASVGVDDEAGSQGSVSFQVYADTTKVFDSGTMTGDSPTQSIDVSVAGANTLRLVTGNGGDNLDNDHADWALARIECGSNHPPTPVIDSPAPTLHWAVGDPISFSGHANDPEDGTLGPSALSWSLLLHHCPTSIDDCHTHAVQSFDGVAGGTVSAPDHDYPSYLELKLTATDSSGAQASTSVRLDPRTVDLTVASNPPGLQLNFNSTVASTPFTKTVIAGSGNALSAPSSQTLGGSTYWWSSWSDNGAAAHNITAATSLTYTATYRASATSLSLTPATGTNLVGSSAALTATARDSGSRPVPGVAVRFTVAGANAAAGSCTTATDGTCSYTYTGSKPGDDTISAYADNSSNSAQDQGEPGATASRHWTAPCRSGTSASFRFHYSANGSSGLWSTAKSVLCKSTLTMGPQAMEGDLRVLPGKTLKVGYDLMTSASGSPVPFGVQSPRVTFQVRCTSGASPSVGTLTVQMPNRDFSLTSGLWSPSSDRTDPLTFEGSITVPSYCGTGSLRLDRGGTFTAGIS